MYVWSKYLVGGKNAFIELCSLNNVNYVFFSANRISENHSNFSRIIQGNNLIFLAMASTNEFSLRSNLALKYIDDVLRFNDAVDDEQRFFGIHFDVEPHALPNYKKDKDDILLKHVKMIEKCYKKTKKYGLEFGVSMPYWYQYNERVVSVNIDGNIKPCSHHIIDNSNHVSIMAYRPRVDQIVSSVKDEMEYSQKKVFVAVDDVSKIKEIKAGLDEHYVFEGIAIHHYNKLLGLKTN